MLAWGRGTSSTSRTQTTEEILSAAVTVFHSRMSTYFGGKSIRPPKPSICDAILLRASEKWHLLHVFLAHEGGLQFVASLQSLFIPVLFQIFHVFCFPFFLPLNSHDRPPVPDIRSYFYDAATGKQYVLWKVDGNAHQVPSCIKMSTLDWAGEMGRQENWCFFDLGPWTRLNIACMCVYTNMW